MALKDAGMKMDDVDAVAYTRGPGMNGCLNVCAGAAKALAAAQDLPLFGIHHMVSELADTPAHQQLIRSKHTH